MYLTTAQALIGDSIATVMTAIGLVMMQKAHILTEHA